MQLPGGRWVRLPYALRSSQAGPIRLALARSRRKAKGRVGCWSMFEKDQRSKIGSRRARAGCCTLFTT